MTLPDDPPRHRLRGACDPGFERVPASPAPMSAAKPNFDGNWSVLIVTEKGTCDRAYRYPVKIENGSVGYAGSASFTVSGKVGDNGAVTVTVARGSQSATGTGRMSGYRRRGHLDRGLRRLLRHLDRRTPFLSFVLHCLCRPLSNLQTQSPASRRAFFLMRGVGPRAGSSGANLRISSAPMRAKQNHQGSKHTKQRQHSPETDVALDLLTTKFKSQGTVMTARPDRRSPPSPPSRSWPPPPSRPRRRRSPPRKHELRRQLERPDRDRDRAPATAPTAIRCASATARSAMRARLPST